MQTTDQATGIDTAKAAEFVRSQMPAGGLFAGQLWRISPEPFRLEAKLAKDLESMGRVLLQFNRAVNLLYRQSLAGKQPAWVAEWLDKGKPAELVELQRSAAFKNDLPRVIRPDILLTENGVGITELDSVPGGIGLTAWLNKTYAAYGGAENKVIGGERGMLDGFGGIFGKAERVSIVVSKESETYKPEMEWVCDRLNERTPGKFRVRSPEFNDFAEGEAVYRFFELFDLPNVPSASTILSLAQEQRVRLTPPPKPIFEEKMLFALLWNRNLRDFWRQELGEGFFRRMLEIVPYTWLVDPTPLPPMAAIPELNLTDWNQLKGLSQKERDLILKVSGFSERAWGARGVYLGSDLPLSDWSAAVDEALGGADRSPFVLQRYHRPRIVESAWHDFESGQTVPMKGRARLCPYYFVTGEGDAARAQLGGVLATICPADKKIIHGMTDAILAPCSA